MREQYDFSDSTKNPHINKQDNQQDLLRKALDEGEASGECSLSLKEVATRRLAENKEADDIHLADVRRRTEVQDKPNNDND